MTQNEKAVKMGMLYELEVRDKNGKLLSKVKGHSKSFLRNWIRMLRTMMNVATASTVSVTLTDTSGVGNAFYGAHATSAMNPTIGVLQSTALDTYGTQVGTSDIAFDKAQYALQGKILHGSAAGQLLYGAVTVEDYYEWDSNAKFRIIRAFTNSSGAPITVKEIGIACANRIGTGTVYYFMLCRDVLASPQTIPDGATLTVRYSLYITY